MAGDVSESRRTVSGGLTVADRRTDGREGRYFAAARPVIASAIMGVPELVSRDTGWLIPAGDAQALAEAILAFAATPKDRLATMGAQARNTVLARHDITVEAEKLAALFASGGRP